MSLNTNKPSYSVLTYIIGDYEVEHPILEKDPEAEYILVTDNVNITSDTWEVQFVENTHPEDPFDLCYKIRFNPFDYVHTDIVVRIDGSLGVEGSFAPIIKKFNDERYDIALEFHPVRQTLVEEYTTWVQERGYNLEQANTILNFLAQSEGYDVRNYKGLYQGGFCIQRNDRVSNNINRMTLALLKYLAPADKQVERLDQTIFSFIINKYFSDIKIMWWDERLFFSQFIQFYHHNTNTPREFTSVKDLCKPFAFNKPYHGQYRPEDF